MHEQEFLSPSKPIYDFTNLWQQRPAVEDLQDVTHIRNYLRKLSK